VAAHVGQRVVRAGVRDLRHLRAEREHLKVGGQENEPGEPVHHGCSDLLLPAPPSAAAVRKPFVRPHQSRSKRGMRSSGSAWGRALAALALQQHAACDDRAPGETTPSFSALTKAQWPRAMCPL
jgi:hypothetical protein